MTPKQNITLNSASWLWHGNVGYIMLSSEATLGVSNQVCEGRLRSESLVLPCLT